MKKEHIDLFNKISTAEKTGNPFAPQECIDILNYRIEQEEISSRLYQSMSLWLNDKGYLNAAKKWQKDADDELVHASWAKDFLLDMGILPKLPTIPAPSSDYSSFPDIIRQSYAHEIVVTNQCNDLASFALKTNNHLLYQLSLKYVSEQQEELGKLQTLIDKLDTFGEEKDVLFMLDESFEG